MESAYLGDGLYVEFDGYQLRLFTDRGQYGVHEVYLEPSVYSNLVAFVSSIKEGGGE